MKRTTILMLTALFSTNAALAAGSHSGGHDDGEGSKDHHEKMAVGEPGNKSMVNKRISLTMKETDDGEMVFQPSSISVDEGQTVQFIIKNKGELVHEFVLDNHDNVMEHKAVMEKFPEMEHDDPNSIRLEPGKRGEVIWKFSNAGEFEFACLIPGHYDAGMKGDLKVSAK
ncbi:plastocyanin/azurin family copper-binding protein [Hoeflea sp. CAU 1731]